MFKNLSIFAVTAASTVALAMAPLPSLAQSKKDSAVMGMTLEPPGLDPTAAAAAAIAEVALYNVYETLTKIKEDGSVSPLLAESWQASPDLKTYTFKLRKGVKFQNGEPFNSAAVKFSFERAALPTSTNKDKSLFQSFESVTTPDPDTVVLALKYSEPNLLFLLGQATASIIEPKSAQLWYMTPNFFRRLRCSSPWTVRMYVPSKRISPSSGVRSPIMHFRSELLPEPEPPRMTNTSPLRTWKLRSFWMTRSPYPMVRCLTSMMGGFSAGLICRERRRKRRRWHR